MAIIALFYLAYMLGKEDGKWGLLFVLVSILLIGIIYAGCS